uniref:Uncharacterized protein n=2 Tax=Cacopsylla melanoneura TaxID=428564 RepID=A0A8D8Z2Y3_9HEMI
MFFLMLHLFFSSLLFYYFLLVIQLVIPGQAREGRESVNGFYLLFCFLILNLAQAILIFFPLSTSSSVSTLLFSSCMTIRFFLRLLLQSVLSFPLFSFTFSTFPPLFLLVRTFNNLSLFQSVISFNLQHSSPCGRKGYFISYFLLSTKLGALYLTVHGLASFPSS